MLYISRIVAVPLNPDGVPIHRASGPQVPGGWSVAVTWVDMGNSKAIDIKMFAFLENNLITGLKHALSGDTPLSSLNSILWKFDSEQGRFAWTSPPLDMKHVVAREEIEDDDGYVYAHVGDTGAIARVEDLTITVMWPGGTCSVCPDEVYFV